MATHSALIIVDIQNDFLPNGNLAIQKSDETVPIINSLLRLPFDCRAATQDWHPQKHCSFAATWGKRPGESILINDHRQELWPEHCIQGTHGAAFSQALDVSDLDIVVHKGTEQGVDSYSTFFDNKKIRSTGLEGYLRKKKVSYLFFAGLSTEYCVFYSVMDALDLGFHAYVILDACRGVELSYGDVAEACKIMEERKVKFIHSSDVAQEIERLSRLPYIEPKPLAKKIVKENA